MKPEYELFDFEQRITNRLGYDPIEHFGDTEAGLIRHLGCMDIVTDKMDLHYQIKPNLNAIRKIIDHTNKLYIQPSKFEDKIDCALEVKADGSKKVLVDNYGHLRRAQPELFR